jgi:hypothetical protein
VSTLPYILSAFLLTIMRNELLFGLLAAVLILGMVSIAENVGAKKKPIYKAVIKINVNIPCVDEFYGRVSDSNINPLVGKFTTKNPKHTITKIQTSFKFDPKKQVPSGFLREYIILEIDDQEVFRDYKHPFTQFDPKRTQYTFTHNINLSPDLCQ